MSNESKRAAFVLPDEKSEYVISQKHFVFRFKDDGDLKAIVCDQSDAHKFTAIDELYEALELQRDFEYYEELPDVAEQNKIVRKWLAKLDEHFPLSNGEKHAADKDSQTEWSHSVFRLLPNVLREKALAKARGETP